MPSLPGPWFESPKIPTQEDERWRINSLVGWVPARWSWRRNLRAWGTPSSLTWCRDMSQAETAWCRACLLALSAPPAPAGGRGWCSQPEEPLRWAGLVFSGSGEQYEVHIAGLLANAHTVNVLFNDINDPIHKMSQLTTEVQYGHYICY